MNQNDLLNWFKEKNLVDENKYFTIKEIETDNLNICSIRRKTQQLYAFGFLDIKLNGVYGVSYKLKIKAKNTELIHPLDKNISFKELKTLQ